MGTALSHRGPGLVRQRLHVATNRHIAFCGTAVPYFVAVKSLPQYSTLVKEARLA